MKVEITPIEIFEVVINGQYIGEFDIESEWNGMIKLRSDKGFIIAIDDRPTLDRLFPVHTPERTDGFEIVKITPSLTEGLVKDGE